jgi:hypothetical protein
MRTDLITKGITFKRNLAGFILNLLMAIFYGGVALLFVVLLTLWGPDLLAILIVLLSIIYMMVFVRATDTFFEQPSSVTITDDKKVIIGKGTKVLEASDVEVEFHQEEMTIGRFIIIFIVGIIPGMIYYLFSGMYKIIFFCNGRRYELRYATGQNINRLLSVLDNRLTSETPLAEMPANEVHWHVKIRKWYENYEKSKINHRIYAIVGVCFTILWLFMFFYINSLI